MSIANRISANSSKIGSIEIYCNLYNEAQGIIIHTKGGKAADEVIQLAATLGTIFTQPRYRKGFKNYLYTNDLHNTEPLFTLLMDCHFISVETRHSLSESIWKIKEIFANRQYVDNTINEMQKTALLEYASLYFDSLVDCTKNYYDVVPFLACTLIEEELFAAPQWIWWVDQQGQAGNIPITDIAKWMSTLIELMQGRADWTDTFMRIGSSIPHQATQRQIIVEGIMAAFEEKYGKPQTTPFEAFYLERALWFVKHGNSHEKRISLSYHIPWHSAFPIFRKTFPLCNYEKFLPTKFEAQLLQKYRLKRFPKSQEDMDLASMKDECDPIITDHKILRMAIDGEWYPNMTRKERIRCAIQDDNSDEMMRLLCPSTYFFDEPLFSSYKALVLACRYNAIECIQELTKCDVIMNDADEEGRTCLHEAASCNNLAVIRLLVEKGAAFRPNKKGRTPLHKLFTSSYSQKLSVEEMIEAIELFRKEWEPMGIDALCDQEGNNCLHIASSHYHRKGILALLKLGASLDIPDGEGLFPYERIFIESDPVRQDARLYEEMVGFLPDILLNHLASLEELIRNDHVKDVESKLKQLMWIYRKHPDNPIDLIFEQTSALYRQCNSISFDPSESGIKAFLNMFSEFALEPEWGSDIRVRQIEVLNRVKIYVLLWGVHIAIDQDKIEDLRRHLDRLEDIRLTLCPFNENLRHRLHYLVFDEYIKGGYPEPEKTAHPDFGRVALGHFDGFHTPAKVKLEALRRLDKELADTIGL